MSSEGLHFFQLQFSLMDCISFNYNVLQRTKLLKQLWFMDVKQELRDILEALRYLSLRRPNFKLPLQMIPWKT
jgi:hypothetical protein